MKRSTIILAGTLAVLAIATYFVLRQPGETSTTSESTETLCHVDSSAVDKLEILTPSGSITLSLEGGTWMVAGQTGKFRADQSAVAAAVGRGKRIELRGLVSTNPEKQKVFQVDSAGTRIRFFEHGSPTASFVIGKPGPSWTETYVRRDGSADVYLAEGPLSYLYAKSLKDWRDRTIFRTDENLITSVGFRYGDTTFTLQRRDSVWLVDQTPAAEGAARSLITTLANLQSDEFIDSTFTPTAAPNAALDVAGTQIRFYLNKTTGAYAVQSSRDPQWFSIQSWRSQQILKRKKDLLQTP
jgi:Domain of unknown function (DUF4340)